MSDACLISPTGGATGEGRGLAASAGPAKWLGLAAAPTFAIMAVLTGVSGGGAMDMLCASGHASPFGGMVLMYALMSAFHASAWLKLISGRRRAVRP